MKTSQKSTRRSLLLALQEASSQNLGLASTSIKQRMQITRRRYFSEACRSHQIWLGKETATGPGLPNNRKNKKRQVRPVQKMDPGKQKTCTIDRTSTCNLKSAQNSLNTLETRASSGPARLIRMAEQFGRNLILMSALLATSEI